MSHHPQYASQEPFHDYYQPAGMQSRGKKNQKGKQPRKQHENEERAAAISKEGLQQLHENNHRSMSQQKHVSEQRPRGHKQSTDRRSRGENPKQQPQKQHNYDAAAATTPLRVNSKQTKKTEQQTK